MLNLSAIILLLTIAVASPEQLIVQKQMSEETDLDTGSSDISPIYYDVEGLAPPQQPNFNNRDTTIYRHNDKLALNFGVDPGQVPQIHQHHKGSTSLPTYGYFPPKTRVMPRVNHIEAECRDDFMKLKVAFNASFEGLIYSAGYSYDSECTYVNGTGDNLYEFYIQLNRCGTLGGSDHHKRDVKNRTPSKNYMWNTVTIQYNPLIEEEWDEHFKVTCEYGYDFWKTVTFPFLEVDKDGIRQEQVDKTTLVDTVDSSTRG